MKQILEKLWYLEKKYDLFNKKINNVYFWKLIRFEVTGIILKELNLSGIAHDKVEGDSVIKRIVNTYLYGVCSRKKNVDILVFQSDRKTLVENKFIDINTEKIVIDLEKKFKNYEVVERKYKNKYYAQADNKRSYSEYCFISNSMKKIIYKIIFFNSEKEILDTIEKEIEELFKVKINLKKILEKKIIKFKIEKKMFNKMLKVRKVKQVFFVCSYGMEALISACSENDIETIEIQHGLIGKYHMGYSFPNNKQIHYFPTRMILFGKYWYDSTPLPLKIENIEFRGNIYLKNMLTKYRITEKKKKQVIFISQGTVGDKMSEIAYKFALKNNEYNIIYKLHPGEYSRWKHEYKFLIEADNSDNFTVVDNNNINLYKYLSESEFLVGHNSTVVYEGFIFSCKAILLDFPGVEYMEYLIEKKIVKLAKNEEEILNYITEYTTNFVDTSYFYI